MGSLVSQGAMGEKARAHKKIEVGHTDGEAQG